jgi:DNA-binding CsgD family transcriptional regulator
MTRQRVEFLRLLAEGLSYKQIAARTNRPLGTIRARAHRTYRELGVLSGTHAVVVAIRKGIIQLDVEPEPTEAEADTRRRILAALVAWAVREGRSPDPLDFAPWTGTPVNSGEVYATFGSWQAALEAAHLRPPHVDDMADMVLEAMTETAAA